jgi:predicted AAA+ superfamily ATPase
MKRTSKEVGALGSRIGTIVENMVKGDIVAKFRAFDYEIDDYCEKKKFENNKIDVHGEIDLFLENGDIAILIEIKTTLETKDVRKHIDRLEKFRRYVDAKGVDKRHFIGAVAGAVIEGEAEEFAHENGIYVIVQSGKAVDIVTPPAGFVAKKW